MRYTIKGGKVVDIPDDQIRKSMALLGLTKSEAVQMWLEDEGYEVNAEQEALEQKAKENRITAKIHQAKATTKPKTQRERVVKEDLIKEGIITAIAELLPNLNATDVVVANKGKLITFKIGADSFKIDLIRQRPPKDKGAV